MKFTANETGGNFSETAYGSAFFAQYEFNLFYLQRGNKHYELTNHLGNVLTVITDKRLLSCMGDTVQSSSANIVSAADYSPFGAPLVGRTFSSEGYSFGFNGKEKDDETYGEGNAYDFGARIYYARLGRWLSLDPLQAKYPGLTPYHFTANCPIIFIDNDGRDFGVKVDNSKGTILITANIYTANKESYNQALNASGELNSLSKIATINGKEYNVTFEINVVPPAKKDAQNLPNFMTDPIGNLYKGTSETVEFAEGKVVGGTTANGKLIKMNKIEYMVNTGMGSTIPASHDAGDNKELVSHEFLHLLGLDDKGGTYFSLDGRMDYSATPTNSFQMKDISNQDVSNILKYAIQNDGKKDINSAKVYITQTGDGDIKLGNGEIKVDNNPKK